MVLEPVTASAERMARRLRAMLFVDVVDSVRLIQQDQESTIQRWRNYVSEVTRDDVQQRQGRMVKALGDGMLVEFESAIDAVECALSMQARIERSEAAFPPEQRIRLRMGIHLADVIIDDLDLYGDGVNLAARLRDLGGPQEIVISAAVRDQLIDGLDVTIEDLGERHLKGMQRPVRAFRAWAPTRAERRGGGALQRAAERPSIAVLPFRNVSGERANDFLGDLIAEDVTGDLSRQIDLFVISPLSTRPFRDRLYEPRNVADVLGVRYVLAGSMQTSGTRLRITAELTEAESGHVIWADRFEGPLTDILELQDRLSREMTKRVVPYVRQIELQRARAKRFEDLTAYERTIRAIDHLHRSSHEDYQLARDLLDSAIQLEPQYVAPRAWLAYWHVRRVGQGWSPDAKQDSVDAKRHAEAALEIDHNDPWALSVYGVVAAYLLKDLETAIARYDRALAINPSAAPGRSEQWLFPGP
jgi:class 3 adenylate cyclase/TolB-like protein